ncbi:MAG: hypothetical protein LC794_20135 [Acidobacteria bacterium]|nr:hypothetical protein [Acidobacteriota bacterium]
MRSKVGAGVVGGLIAGVVFGMMMQIMTVPTPDGKEMPMMQMVAMVVRSESMAVGWLYHLFNSAVIGGIFGWVLGNRAGSYGAGLGWGAAYGVFWWLLGAQILMPILLGMPPFASIIMPPMRMVAVGSLVGHLIFGLILGAAFVWLSRPRGVVVPRSA